MLKKLFGSFAKSSGVIEGLAQDTPVSQQDLKFLRTTSIAELHQFFEAILDESSPQLPSAKPYKAYCYVCQRQSLFSVPKSGGYENWRESLMCESCLLINRWRSCFHLFEELAKPASDSSIYITEAITPLYDLVSSRYPNTKGSEYFPSVKFGEHVRIGKRRVHNQDVTNLTFADSEFDCVLTFDVLEHVPGYERALL